MRSRRNSRGVCQWTPVRTVRMADSALAPQVCGPGHRRADSPLVRSDALRRRFPDRPGRGRPAGPRPLVPRPPVGTVRRTGRRAWGPRRDCGRARATPPRRRRAGRPLTDRTSSGMPGPAGPAPSAAGGRFTPGNGRGSARGAAVGPFEDRPRGRPAAPAGGAYLRSARRTAAPARPDPCPAGGRAGPAAPAAVIAYGRDRPGPRAGGRGRQSVLGQSAPPLGRPRTPAEHEPAPMRHFTYVPAPESIEHRGRPAATPAETDTRPGPERPWPGVPGGWRSSGRP